MTNLYYIAVLSPIHQSYKIGIWFIWKIFPYLRCRFRSYYKGREWLLHVSLRIPKWKFNVSVTMGQVFHVASYAVFCFLCFVCATYFPITIGNKFYKNTFSLFWYCALFLRLKNEIQFRHVWWLHVSCVRAERCFNKTNVLQSRNAYFSSPSPISYQTATTDRWWIEKWL